MGIIFPPTLKPKYSTFFRIETLLTQPIVKETLQKALDMMVARFPSFHVRIRKGFFWYFFEPCDTPIQVRDQKGHGPCEYNSINEFTKDAPLWRVLVDNNIIALECSHILSDGGGAIEILRTLLCTYYELQYEKISDWGNVYHIKNMSSIPQETEYSYRKYYKPSAPPNNNFKYAFRYPDTCDDQYKSLYFLMSMPQIKQIAKEHKVTITEFIVAIKLFAIQRLYKNKFISKRLVRILILVNLRGIFESKTLRNFFSYVYTSIDFALGEYSFEEILKLSHHQIQEQLNIKKVQQLFSEQVSVEKNFFCKIVPRWLKDKVLNIAQQVMGERKITSSLSNLGIIQLPEELKSFVSCFSLFPLPSMLSTKNLAVATYNDTLSLSFGRYITNTNLEEEMATVLTSLGIDIQRA